MRLLRIYRLLLILYPRSFRSAHGLEMLQFVRESVREQTANGTAGWIRAVADLARDLLVSVPRERIAALRSRYGSLQTPLGIGCAAVSLAIAQHGLALIHIRRAVWIQGIPSGGDPPTAAFWLAAAFALSCVAAGTVLAAANLHRLSRTARK
jgi:hypothetical protein